MWTFESNAQGYMLFQNGEPVGGAGTLGTATHASNGKRRHWRHVRANAKMFREEAERECVRRNTEMEMEREKYNGTDQDD